MKRKLNKHDVPQETDPNPNDTAQTTQFNDLGLDARLLQAALREKYFKPTPVQVKAIPLALEGKDILGKWRFLLLNKVRINKFQHALKPARAKPLPMSSPSFNRSSPESPALCPNKQLQRSFLSQLASFPARFPKSLRPSPHTAVRRLGSRIWRKEKMTKYNAHDWQIRQMLLLPLQDGLLHM
jgi:hypothetical protein